jgi:hypothetical protein
MVIRILLHLQTEPHEVHAVGRSPRLRRAPSKILPDTNAATRASIQIAFRV